MLLYKNKHEDLAHISFKGSRISRLKWRGKAQVLPYLSALSYISSPLRSSWWAPSQAAALPAMSLCLVSGAADHRFLLLLLLKTKGVSTHLFRDCKVKRYLKTPNNSLHF